VLSPLFDLEREGFDLDIIHRDRAEKSWFEVLYQKALVCYQENIQNEQGVMSPEIHVQQTYLFDKIIDNIMDGNLVFNLLKEHPEVCLEIKRVMPQRSDVERLLQDEDMWTEYWNHQDLRNVDMKKWLSIIEQYGVDSSILTQTLFMWADELFALSHDLPGIKDLQQACLDGMAKHPLGFHIGELAQLFVEHRKTMGLNHQVDLCHVFSQWLNAHEEAYQQHLLREYDRPYSMNELFHDFLCGDGQVVDMLYPAFVPFIKLMELDSVDEFLEKASEYDVELSSKTLDVIRAFEEEKHLKSLVEHHGLNLTKKKRKPCRSFEPLSS